jgi:hypothetical protein
MIVVAGPVFKLNPTSLTPIPRRAIWKMRLDMLDAKAQSRCQPSEEKHNTLLVRGRIRHPIDCDLPSNLRLFLHGNY